MTTIASIDLARVRDTVFRLVDEHHLPGVSVGVVSGDDLIYAEGFGCADIESRRPMAPELRQRIGSITKTMTGLCAMALVDEGRLRLDNRVVDILPDVAFIGPAETMTVWHLLTHTSGIGEAPNLTNLATAFTHLFNEAAPTKRLAAAEAYPEGITVEVPPGTKWAYANHAYMLLGEIISRTENLPVDQVIQRRVFDRLGMKDSDLSDRPHPDLSPGYHHLPPEEDREAMIRLGAAWEDDVVVDGYNARGKYLYSWFSGAAGGAQSTVPDMARYASALLRESAGIVRPRTFHKMISRHWSPDPRLPAWGLGFEIRKRFDRLSYGHGGGVLGGWNSHLCLYPQGNDLAIKRDSFHQVFCPDVDAAQAALMASTQRPATDVALTGALPTDTPAWKTIPSWFVFGEKDLIIPAELHRFMAKRANARGTREIAGASHALSVSQLDAVVASILEAVEAVSPVGARASFL